MCVSIRFVGKRADHYERNFMFDADNGDRCSFHFTGISVIIFPQFLHIFTVCDKLIACCNRSLEGMVFPDDFGRGTVAMARAQSMDSASTTFFIVVGEADEVGSSLNGKYAAFGTVDEAGMKIVDQIMADYLPNVDDPSLGTIDPSGEQAIIESIAIDA